MQGLALQPVSVLSVSDLALLTAQDLWPEQDLVPVSVLPLPLKDHYPKVKSLFFPAANQVFWPETAVMPAVESESHLQVLY